MYVNLFLVSSTYPYYSRRGQNPIITTSIINTSPDYPAQLLDCVLGNCPDAPGHPYTMDLLTLTYFFCTYCDHFFGFIISTSTFTALSSSTTTKKGAAKSMNGSISLMGLGAIMVLVVILVGSDILQVGGEWWRSHRLVIFEEDRRDFGMVRSTILIITIFIIAPDQN